MTEKQTPLDMLEHWEATFPNQIYLRQSTGSEWIEYSWASVANRVRRLATYIQKKDLPTGSNIVIWSGNSADWIVADLAIMMAGHVTVPIYPAQDLETAQYILEHCEAKMLFVGAFECADRLSDILPEGISTIAMRGASVPCSESLQQVVEKTEPSDEFPSRKWEDVATIIYSSGTSGNPKGVVHTFQSISETGPLIAKTYKRVHCQDAGDSRERIISYLPLAHAAERALVEITSLYLNSSVSISAGLEYFADEVRSVRPTFFGAVPRIWFKFREGVEAALKSMNKTIETEEDRNLVRQMLGLDATISTITGSAPISPEVHKWYAEIGLPLRESYSLTETFSHGSYWDHDAPCSPGCVGRAAEGVELKLDETNQILLKSPSLMKGYYKDEAATADSINDGWFATGDLGRLDEDGNLWIIGRVGSVFKSGKGKFIHPERLEHELQKDPWVEQVMVGGRGQAQPIALISLAESIRETSDENIAAHFTETRDRLNKILPPYERIGVVLVVRDIWDAENGILTPTLKIRRTVLEKKYASQIPNEASGIIIKRAGDN